MKILVIAPQPFFTPRGTPFSVYYRTLITTELGSEVDILTYGEGADVAIPGTRIFRIPSFTMLGHVKVGPSFLKLFLDIFLFFYSIKLLLQHKYDVVHAHEEAIFYCRFLQPLFGFRLIYDMHSSLPQQLTNFQFTSSKIIIGLFKKLEDSCLRKADAIITICPDLASYVNSRIEDRDKHFLIENSIFDLVKLMKNNSCQKKEATEEEEYKAVLPIESPSVVYAGTLEPYQGIDTLIRGFALFVKQKPEYQLLIIGGTPEQTAKYFNLARECGIEQQSIFTGQVSQPTARHYCAGASILVSPRSKGTNTPLKVYEQLESNIPLVATNIYSHTQVLNDSVAFLVEPTREGLAKGLLEATGEVAADKAANAHKLYEQRYSRVRYTGKIKNLFAYLEQKMT